ncbi:hypothetical protein ANO11243_071480 [Dothideomycetidae sp. 11243]|nr:hypothetical protein ANO11243_071480 [fungal sp. No.11243]
MPSSSTSTPHHDPNLLPRHFDVKVNYSLHGGSEQATVHYVSAGSASKPTLLLLHGFPSSSHQFRNFIPLLADSYHIFAPDLPGFGLTRVPDHFVYTFESLTAVTTAFIKTMNLKDMAIYLFDYGAPVGFHIAKNDPGNVKALITQNGNAYEDGLGKFWGPLFKLWESNSAESREVINSKVLTLDGIKGKYCDGVPEEDLPMIDPATWQLDYYQNIASHKDRQLDLFYDYRNNVKNYPAFHEYFRNSKVPILAVWGKNDTSFIPPGAEAFKKDSPSAEVHLVDSGHFPLETKRWEIAAIMKRWLQLVGFE